MLRYPISVFLDTNIFIGAKYDFSSKGILGILLNQISDEKIKLYISEIVRCEVEKHIEQDFLKLGASFKKARKESVKMISDNLIEQTSISHLFKEIDADSVKGKAVSVFGKFLKEAKAIILDNSAVDCNRVFSDYFSGIPPFETKENKKNEFPDAIMAAKLKMVFGDGNPVYIISNDTGFRNSFEDQNGFVTFASLKELFDLINSDIDRRKQIYNKITSFISEADVHKSLCEDITYKLESNGLDIDGMDCDRKGLCEGYEYEEVDIDDVSQLDFKLSSIDEITEDIVSVTLLCTAIITATCTYFDEEGSVWDSEEKEYAFSSWGRVEEEHHPEFYCEAVFTIDREKDEVNFEVKTINVDIELDQQSRVKRTCISSY